MVSARADDFDHHDPMRIDPAGITRLALDQGGLVSRRQAAELGFDDAAISRRVKAGLWGSYLGCLVVGSQSAGSDLRDAWAVRVRLGPNAVLSGATALRLTGWSIDDRRLVAWCPATEHSRVPGVLLLRDAIERRTRRGPAGSVALPGDALLDLIRVADELEVPALIDLGVRHRVFVPGRVAALVAGRLGRGRTGAQRLAALVEHVDGGTRSAAERLVPPLLKRTRIRGWVSNYPIYDARGKVLAELDFALPELGLCLEIDGHAFHSTRADFERDRVRQNLIVNRGWLVLRFTWQRLRDEPDVVVAEIRAAVALRRRILAA